MIGGGPGGSTSVRGWSSSGSAQSQCWCVAGHLSSSQLWIQVSYKSSCRKRRLSSTVVGKIIDSSQVTPKSLSRHVQQQLLYYCRPSSPSSLPSGSCGCMSMRWGRPPVCYDPAGLEYVTGLIKRRAARGGTLCRPLRLLVYVMMGCTRLAHTWTAGRGRDETVDGDSSSVPFGMSSSFFSSLPCLPVLCCTWPPFFLPTALPLSLDRSGSHIISLFF